MNDFFTDINWVKVAPYIWLGIAVIMGIIEGVTVALITLWPAMGALLAMVAAILRFPYWAQILIFVVSSLALMLFTRPVAIKYLKVGNVKTNVGALIGKKALVLKTIEKYATGQVKLDGKIWTAILDDNIEEKIEEGQEVVVIRIEGVKAVVSTKPSAENIKEKNE